MKKYNQLKNYHKKTVINLLLSKVIYESLETLPKKIKLKLKIIQKEVTATQYLYLFLLLEQKPYVKKKTKSISQQFTRVEVKKMSELSIEIEKKNKSFFCISKILFELIALQFSSQNNIIGPLYDFKKISINLYQGLLLKKIEKLKSKHNYFSDFGIKAEIILKTTSIYEKLFLLKHLGFFEVENLIPELNYT